MATAGSSPRYTPREYLERERLAETRSEYLDGEIYAMSGASRPHSLIAMNLGGEIRAALKGRPCETYATDMRVHVDATGLYTYPDIVVACGKPEFLDGEVDTLLNPTLIIEILSRSTAAYDRGRKFSHYKQIPSLREYVLVSQDRMRIERYVREGDAWPRTEWDGVEGELPFASIGVAIPFAEIYARVALDDPTS